MNPTKGLLIDIDGVLIEDNQAIDGSVDHLNRLRKEYKIRLLTNTTTKTVDQIHALLIDLGFLIDRNEIITAPVAAKLVLQQKKITRLYPVLNENLLQEFEDFTVDKSSPQAILIGDIGKSWNYELLNKLFNCVMNGAELIALHKGRFWKSEGAIQLDIGMFVAGLEYATGKSATVIGKPSALYFEAALRNMDLSSDEVWMIGDDIDGDIGGAQGLGIKSCLVKTGKYNEAYVESSIIKPDKTVDAFQQVNL